MQLKKKDELKTTVKNFEPPLVNDEPKTVLAAGVLFEGKFKSDEPMFIHGEVLGNIKSTSDIVLSEDGKYTGILTSNTMKVSGIAEGTFTCSEAVEIAEAGIVIGDLSTSRFIMSDDATFEGNLKVKKSKISK